MSVLDFLRGRKGAYQQTFMSMAGQQVLQDLSAFCRANETCFHPDPRLHAVAEGRREVWLRIQQHLNLTGEQLAELYAGKTIAPKGGV
jgi:hypothetical protein